MIFNLKDQCENSKSKECYYGAKLNKAIEDCYIGYGILEPGEQNRKIGPGRGHEEILFILKGSAKIYTKEEEFPLQEGEVYHLGDGKKLRISNLTNDKIEFIIAGGHTKFHSH